MNSSQQDETIAVIGSDNRNDWLLTMGLTIGLMTIFECILRWIGSGGIFSFVLALHAVSLKKASINVDSSSLRLPFVIATSLVGTLIFSMLKVNINKRPMMLIYCFFIMGGGFLMDELCGGKLIGHILEQQGYMRCVALDHNAGRGKGEIRFNNYVKKTSDCPGLISQNEHQ